MTACQRGDCCSRTETVTETVPKGLLLTQDNPDVSAHSETSSHLCFSLHTLLPLHLLHCEVLSANSHVRKATGRKQNCLAQSLYCQASGVSRGPGFIKCKRLVLKSSATKHVLLSKPLTCFLFPLQCFLCNSGLLFDKEHKFWRIHLIQNLERGKCHVLKGSCSKCQSCSLLPAGLGV